MSAMELLDRCETKLIRRIIGTTCENGMCGRVKIDNCTQHMMMSALAPSLNTKTEWLGHVLRQKTGGQSKSRTRVLLEECDLYSGLGVSGETVALSDIKQVRINISFAQDRHGS